MSFLCYLGFSGGSEVKASACNAGELGSIPGLGRSPGEGNGYPIQYSCLENPMDRGAWWAILHGVAKSQTRLSDFTLATFIVPEVYILVGDRKEYPFYSWKERKKKNSFEVEKFNCMRKWHLGEGKN